MKTNDGVCDYIDAVPRISFHAQQRLRQRGLREADLERMRQCGEEFSDGYLMSDRAISERVSVLKAEIQHLERLKGIVIIEQDDTLVTVYRSDRKRRRRILSNGNSRRRKHK
ncbi:MAG: hypothetical protein M3H12_14810 [Chromatiales bacterium]|nr:hypothetical protein [Gammaproteobacteria bacterium]